MSDTAKPITIDLSEEDLQPLIERSTLIGLLTAAHAIAEQLDNLAAAIADEVGIDASSDAITDAVYSMTDAPDAADVLLKARAAPQARENLN